MSKELPFRELERVDQVGLLLCLPFALAWVVILNIGTLIDGAAHYWFDEEQP